MGMLMRRHRNRYVTNRAGDVARSGEVRPTVTVDKTDATAVPVTSLGRHLGRMYDAAAVRDAMERDTRKSARALYEARLRELTPDDPDEGEATGDGEPTTDAPTTDAPTTDDGGEDGEGNAADPDEGEEE